jgi:hypothetical protein
MQKYWLNKKELKQNEMFNKVECAERNTHALQYKNRRSLRILPAHPLLQDKNISVIILRLNTMTLHTIEATAIHNACTLQRQY